MRSGRRHNIGAQVIAWMVVVLGMAFVLLFILGSMRYGGTEGLVQRVRAQMNTYRPHPAFVPTPLPTPTLTHTPTHTHTPTLHPVVETFTIEGLRTQDFTGGTIEVRWVYTTTATFSRYYIAYSSGDLTITGVMHVPRGDGPFPVVILNHGYIPPERYWSGADTWNAAEFLVQRGYLTLASDYRGWGGSDKSDDFLRVGLTRDVLNLVGAVPSLPQADPKRIGMWGHSLGGGITTRVIAVEPRIRAAVLWPCQRR